MTSAEGVMSTIPSTSETVRVPYTVVGGKPQAPVGERNSLSCVLLSRGGRQFKSGYLQEILSLGFNEIISLEGPGSGYDVEGLSRKFPEIRFIIFHEDISPGEKLNIGIGESNSAFSFVLWNDMRIPPGSLTDRFKERLSGREVLCNAPVLLNLRHETVPSVQAPAFFRSLLKVLPLAPQTDPVKTLFPFDYCGIYSTERFKGLGGFDGRIKSLYWQKMDFGFRAYLWDERILVNPFLKLSYLGELPVEDTTPDRYYPLFYIKNLAVKLRGGAACLPATQFLAYLSTSGENVFTSLKEFSEVRAWVFENSSRFKQDARRITEQWEV
jgi:hypothetical protein